MQQPDFKNYMGVSLVGENTCSEENAKMIFSDAGFFVCVYFQGYIRFENYYSDKETTIREN